MGVPFAISKSFSGMAYSPAVPVSEPPLPPPFEPPLPLPFEPPLSSLEPPLLLPPFEPPLPPLEPPPFTPFPEPGPNCHVYVRIGIRLGIGRSLLRHRLVYAVRSRGNHLRSVLHGRNIGAFAIEEFLGSVNRLGKRVTCRLVRNLARRTVKQRLCVGNGLLQRGSRPYSLPKLACWRPQLWLLR